MTLTPSIVLARVAELARPRAPASSRAQRFDPALELGEPLGRAARGGDRVARRAEQRAGLVELVAAARGSGRSPPGPVSASIRRTLAALEPSETIAKIPTSAVLATWVPPQSSRETSSTSTTRTQSPYFSPNSAIAPSASASARLISQRPHRAARLDPVVDAVLDRAQLLGARAARRG